MAYSTVAVPVVGVTFVGGYPRNLTALADLIKQREGAGQLERVPAVLLRRPNNPHDHNAVEVHVPAVGLVGHVSRDVAARLAPKMDAGIKYRAEVDGVRVHPDHTDRPGVDILISRVEG